MELDLAAALNAVLGRGARKRLAAEACVPTETAKNWLEGRYPAARKRQLSAILIRHCDQQRKALDAILQQASQDL